MTRLRASKARAQFSDTINRVAYRGERIVLHRRGKDLVAVVPLSDLAALEKLEDQLDLEAAKKALAEAGERIPYEQVRRELGLAK
jgi:prevent-host-death family protein